MALRNQKLDFRCILLRNEHIYDEKGRKPKFRFFWDYRMHWKNDTTLVSMFDNNRYVDSFFVQYNNFHPFYDEYSYYRQGDSLVRKEYYAIDSVNHTICELYDQQNRLIQRSSSFGSQEYSYAYTVTDSLETEKVSYSASGLTFYEYQKTMKEGLPVKYVFSYYDEPVVHHLVYRRNKLKKVLEYIGGEPSFIMKIRYYPKGLSAKRMKPFVFKK